MPSMAGLRWTCDQLVRYLNKQRPESTGSLNPMIRNFLLACPNSSVFGLGGHSVVLYISSGVAAKVSLQAGDERLRHEQHIFELLDRSQCPHLAQCLFRGVDVIFLELLANGTLHDRMSISKPKPVLSWMQQLSSAAACLEHIGYAHGDINPQNILLDAHDQARLIDFDHAFKVGDALDVGYEPYVRQHREFSGGLFGTAGPVTEQLALGSVFRYITRNNELYSDLEGAEQVDLMLDGKFPETDPDDPIDRIITKCWNGMYPQIADLVGEVEALPGLETRSPKMVPVRQNHDRTRLCESYYKSSLELKSARQV